MCSLGHTKHLTPGMPATTGQMPYAAEAGHLSPPAAGEETGPEIDQGNGQRREHVTIPGNENESGPKRDLIAGHQSVPMTKRGNVADPKTEPKSRAQRKRKRRRKILHMGQT